MNFVDDYTVLDLEMTGLAVKKDKIIEVGAIKVRNNQIVDTFKSFVNPHMKLSDKIINLTGIEDGMLVDAPEEDEVMYKLIEFIGDDCLVGQNLIFDYSFIKQWAVNKNLKLDLYYCDTLKIARTILPKDEKKDLENLCKFFDIKRENAHRALDDSIETMQIYEKMKEIAKRNDLEKLCFLPRKFNVKLKKQLKATNKQKEQLTRYLANKNVKYEINWETLTRNEASRIMDRLYVKYGR
ncbi:PolC-type DNA polymerase III [Lachnobacterium bovis]|uniref:DNA polymerase-3 subunit alpha n=1 Tax=Lachnobacterium bovis TaxID=140626 RepID=A0A1H9TJF5_9FIRM|nr:exonuclease domain-containing protein [Lachnobacterium bovis]SER96999.1 DNA polymerase-3 subunit alpha [Lachnobacterium bovis]